MGRRVLMGDTGDRTTEFTETGCYFDSHRGHYISREVIEFAVSHGFVISPADAYVVARYDDDGHAEDYPQETIIELCDEAVAWLNSSATEREVSGQNMPPARPDGYVWSFNEGAFGLYSEYEDTRVEDADDEHGVCPDCGDTGTKIGPNGYTHCVRYLSCWAD